MSHQNGDHAQEAGQALFSLIDDGACLVEPLPFSPDGRRDYRVLAMNPAAQALFGVPDLSGQSLRDTIPSESEAWVDDFDHVLHTGNPLRVERYAAPQGLMLEMRITRVENGRGPRLLVVMRDMTRQKEADAALRSSEERLGLAIEIGRLASWDWDMQTGHVTWSDRHFLLQGYAVGEVTPSFEAWLARVHPEDRDETLGLIERARDTHTIYEHDFRTLHPDGQVRWCAARGRFFYDAAGHPIRMIGVMEDVTERRQIDLALRRREADLARVQRIGQVGGLDIDVAHGLTSRRSPEYLRLHGLPQDGRIETHAEWLARVHPEDREAAEHTLLTSLNGDAPTYESEYRIIRPSDGATRWIHARADIERDAAGQPVRLVGAHLDVTDQKHLSAAIRRSEERLRRVLEGMGEGFGILAPDFTVLEHNREALRMDGRSREEVVGRSHWDAFPGSEHSDVGRFLRKAMSERQPVSLEHQYAWEEGHASWLEMRAYPTDDGMLAVFWQDISDRKQAEAERREREERQAFLLHLSDALRAETDADAIERVSLQRLADQLKLDRCFTIQKDHDVWHVLSQWAQPDIAPMPVMVRDRDVPKATDLLTDRTLVVGDVLMDPDLSEAERGAIEALDVGALVASSLRSAERTSIWALVAVSRQPRQWSAADVALVEAVAERTWTAVDAALLRRRADIVDALLMRFSEETHGSDDVDEIAALACHLLADSLGAERAYWTEIDWTTREYVVGASYQDGDAPAVTGRLPLDEWDVFTKEHLAGRPVVVDDTQNDPRVPPSIKSGYAALAIGADLAVGVTVAGRLRGTLAVNQRRPRRWTPQDVALVQGIAGRCWAAMERARAATVLRESERRYRTLFQSMDEGYLLADVLFDERGQAVDIAYVAANPAAIRMMGVDPVGRRLREISPGYEDYWYEIWGRVAVTGQGERMERFTTPPNIWVDFYVFKPEPENQASRRVAVLFQDVTTRRVAQDVQRESEARHRYLISTFAQAVWETDASGVVVTDSPSWRAYTGQSLDEWLGHGWPNAVHPDDRDDARRQWREAVASRSLVNAEFRLRMASGEWRWANVLATPLLDAEGRIEKWAGMNVDIDERKRAEAALRASEERQAFLLKLSDAIRPLVDPIAIQTVTLRLLAEHLGLSRAAYSEINEDHDRARRVATYDRDLPPVPRDVRISDFSADQLAYYLEGRSFVVSDTETDQRVAATRESCRAIQVRAWVGVPVVKNGRLVSVLGVEKMVPHDWTAAEIELVQEVTERTWAAAERGHIEGALRESERRFQQFASASSGALWIRNAETLHMEYVSPAMETIYGVGAMTLSDGIEAWARRIVPEDRALALAQIDRARAGDPVAHEFRIQRASDNVFRWIRNTVFPLRDGDTIARIGGIIEDITETRQLSEHQAVLLAELQHRVRNIMALIRAMTGRTARGAESPEAYRSLLEGRLLALARVQALLTQRASTGGSLRAILESEIAAQAHHGRQYQLSGPDVTLGPKTTEVLTLAFHELATNALKYGALSVPEGRLTVSWTPFERRGTPWLALDWVEEGAPPRDPPTRRGFGSELIEARIPYELGGKGKISFGNQGAACRLEFPLKDAESILETDAPRPAAIFGGVLDMTDAPDLSGRKVLVVEDDYFIAHDTAAALRGAGAEVLGPCPSLEATLDLLETETPTHAAVDLNLGGGGPRFEIAHALKARGIPFVFMTGYDPDVIPPELTDVPRLQKPAPFRAIVTAISQL